MRDVIEMAREANLYADANWALWPTGNRWKEVRDERFAELVRADERERALAAPTVQEPVGYFTVNDYDKWEQIDGTSGKPLYECPAAQPAPVQDSTCSETLRAQGKAYPRTCKKCGLGPCIGAPKQPPAQPAPVQPVAWVEYETGNHTKRPQNCGTGYCSCIECVMEPAVPDAFGTREGEHPEYIQGWNDCRAETLKMRKP